MTSAQYEVHIDFDKDDLYAHALSDISAYVTRLQWNNGMSNDEQEFAPPARLTLTLDNRMGDFNLEESGATFYGLFREGLLVMVRAIFNGSMHTLFIGKLAAPAPLSMAAYGDHTFTLTARDMMSELLDAEFLPVLETDVTTGEALKQPFRVGMIALPYASSYWVLGVSVLGVNTVLLGEAEMVDFETGQTTLAYAGDISGGNTTVRAQQFLREIVAAECGGRFFYNTRSGKFTFHDRHHDINPTSAVTLTKSDMEEADYIPQSPVINSVTVHYQPREVGAAGTVIYTSANPIRLAALETKNMTVRYKDDTLENVRIGAMDFIIPQRSVDYIAHNTAAGSGTEVSHRLVVSVKFGATSAEISITNVRKTPIFVTTLQLRGTPLRSFSRQSVTTEPDGQSVYDYDSKSMTLSVPAIDDEELAQQYADSIASLRREPFAQIRRVRFSASKSDARMTQALSRTVGEAITVTNDDFGHSQTYAIVGEQHSVTPGGDGTHEVTWILKTLRNAQYWVLGVPGYSELGETTTLAF